jgi:glucuronosyltransferase
MLKSEGLNEILNYPDDFKFEAVIYDFLCGPCILPLLHKFKYPPLIGATAFHNPSFKIELIGGHTYPAYVPFYGMNYGSNMNFFQRFFNTIIYNFESQ